MVGYSFEPLQRGGSNEHPAPMFEQNKENIKNYQLKDDIPGAIETSIVYYPDWHAKVPFTRMRDSPYHQVTIEISANSVIHDSFLFFFNIDILLLLNSL